MVLQKTILALTFGVAAFASMAANAAVISTADTGLSQPQSTIQPSLALNAIVNISGPVETLGQIKYFGGNFAPSGWAEANGQLMAIAGNELLFSALGASYGGDGRSTFALPDLRGRTANGDGTGSGLSSLGMGQKVGSDSVTFNVNNLAAHDHAMDGFTVTSVTGSGTPYNNLQPGLGINYSISLLGEFPFRDGPVNTSSTPTLGFIEMFASTFAPAGYVSADGQLMAITGSEGLFALYGTMFGGDGRTTFGLPDLQGRTPIGVGAGPGLSTKSWGQESGVEQLTLSAEDLPSHVHGLPPTTDFTFATGLDGLQSNMQPTLGLRYLVRTEGAFPLLDGDIITDPFLGEIVLFGGNYTPLGWAAAEGQLLSIATNTALFSLFGTIYGGDGRTTFALPDLRGRVAVGEGSGPGLSSWFIGSRSGSEGNFLSISQMATHHHEYGDDTPGTPDSVPAPGTLGLLLAGLIGLASFRRRQGLVERQPV